MTDNRPERVDPLAKAADFGMSRRTLLRGAVGLAGLSVAPLLAACGGSSDASSGATTASGPVRRGGTLKVGFVGGGTAETQNPTLGVTPLDSARIQNLFDPLVFTNSDLSSSPALALEWKPNSDATSYEVQLRQGVEFHNGKSFGADDVIYSLRQMAAKTSAAAPFVSNINLNDLKAINKTAVRIPLTTPDANLAANFQFYNTWIVQDGETDFLHPVGTGPFQYVSFTPGQQSVYKKNPNYWVTGKPYVDMLKIQSITDNGARLNALLSGQIDAMAQLPTANAKALMGTGQIQVLDAKSPEATMFYVDTTKAPFNDNRVRMALKLIADRPALIAEAVNGFGSLGNDIVGKGLEFYDDSLPQRTQDIDQAKHLLKAAGQEGLSVVLQTSPISPGFVESATAFKQQATAAGVNITLQQVPADAYYNPGLKYLKMPFAQTQWALPGALKFFYLQALASNAPYPETHWHDPHFQELLIKAIGELDPTKAQDYWNQVQGIQYNEGGYLNWTNTDWVDGLSLKVQGLKPSSGGGLGFYRFLDVWLSQ